MSITPQRSAGRDERTGEMNERKVVCGLALPADAQGTEVIVPAIGALDDPATRSAANAADQRRLSAASDVRTNATQSDLVFGIGVVVALVETKMLGAARATGRPQRDRVQRWADHPLVVNVGARQNDADGHPALIGQDVALATELAAIGRIGARVLPPFGAFTEALSSEAHSQPMPRSSSYKSNAST